MISDTELESGLRGLRTRADAIASPPSDLAQRTRERYRAQRRARAGWAAGGLVAALVLVGVPVLGSTIAAAPGRGQTATPSDRTFVPSEPDGLYALPPRGGLADDEEWLADVAALAWAPVDPAAQPPGVEAPDPPVGTRRVAFAGDVTSGRVALVLGVDSNLLVHAWFTGPEGAGPDEMELASFPSSSGPADALALRDAPGPVADPITLVVVGHPGDTVDIVFTPVVESSGTVREDRVPLEVEDGVATVDVDLAVPLPRVGGGVRVQRSDGADRGLSVEESDRLRADATEGMPALEVEAADPRGLGPLTHPQASRWAVGSTIASYGLTADQARPTLLAAGPLGSRVNQYGELYGMTHPSGATSTWLITYSPGAPDSATGTEFPPAPAGTELLDRVIAVQAMAGVMVSAPSGVEAQVLDAGGNVVATVPLARGAGTAPLNSSRGVTVRILDADGDVLAEAPVERADR